jgi:septal ring factor EnvC (AmiA/AmiB activator)
VLVGIFIIKTQFLKNLRFFTILFPIIFLHLCISLIQYTQGVKEMPKTNITTLDAINKLVAFNQLYNNIVSKTVEVKNTLTEAEWELEDAKNEILNNVSDIKELGSNAEQREAKISALLKDKVKTVRTLSLQYELAKAEEQKCRANLDFAKQLVRATESLMEA